jgi:branched-subunit amino acid transport protein
MPSARSLLVIAVILAIAALVAILRRLFVEYERGTLTTGTLLVGWFSFAGVFALTAAGIAILARGPGL